MTVVERFIDACNQHQFNLSEKQINQFSSYFELLVEWNDKMNLTAIVDEEGVYFKHFFDSLTIGFQLNINPKSKLIDVGSGAGFPSIPLKIMYPDLNVTILDSLNKRILFLQNLTDSLQLNDVTLLHGRAEEVGQDKLYRESFDIATARAVARLSVLSEYCIPFVRIGGVFLAMKGSGAENEAKEGLKAVRTLGASIVDHFTFELPFNLGERSILKVEKVKATPKNFPRKPGVPNKTPIE